MTEKPLDSEDIKTTLEIGKKWNATWFVPDNKRDEKLLEEMEKTKWIKIERIKSAIQGLQNDINEEMVTTKKERSIYYYSCLKLIKKWLPDTVGEENEQQYKKI